LAVVVTVVIDFVVTEEVLSDHAEAESLSRYIPLSCHTPLNVIDDNFLSHLLISMAIIRRYSLKTLT
jgi:hypothetical protein